MRLSSSSSEYLLDWSRAHPIYVDHARRAPRSSRSTRAGASHLRNYTSLTLEPLGDDGDRRSAARPRSGTTRRRRRRASASAQTGRRSTPWRRCGCSSTAACSSGARRGYDVAGDLATLDVPETLQALIAARLDGLESGRAPPAPERRRARQDVRSARPRCRRRTRGGCVRAAPRSARAQGDARARLGSTLAGTRPVRVRAGARSSASRTRR